MTILPLVDPYTYDPPYIRVYDDEFNYIGEIAEFISLQFTSRANAVGEWQIEMDRSAPGAPLLGRDQNTGGGIAVYRNGELEFSGPIWSRTNRIEGRSGQGILTAGGPSHDVHLIRRLIYPNPAQAPGDNTAEYYRTGPATIELVMRDLVRKNASNEATLVGRRIAALGFGTYNGLGATMTSPKYRFTVLLEALQQLSAISAFDAENPAFDVPALGFRVDHVDNELKFQVYEPRNLTDSARFSFERGTLATAEWSEQGPQATYLILGAGNVEDSESRARIAAQLFDYELTDSYFPARVEQFIDVGVIDTAASDAQQQLDQQAADAFETGQGSVGAVIEPIDTNYLRYGRDYRLGDLVSVELPDLTFTAPVREISFTYDTSGEHIEIAVGTPDGAYNRRNPGSERRYGDIAKLLRRYRVIK